MKARLFVLSVCTPEIGTIASEVMTIQLWINKVGAGYETNPRDKQRQRQNKRRRNKVIHGASTSLGSRFRGGPDAKDFSDIFVYHVACDSTIEDVKSHLKQQEIPVQQIRIYIISNKDAMYKPFRVIAPGTYKDMLMSPEVWPVGVKVREYESHIWTQEYRQ